MDWEDRYGHAFYGGADAKPKKTAVIITGNWQHPSQAENPKLQALKFYGQLQQLLEAEGYKVKFDPGHAYTVPPKADVWIGHSKGADRLRFAPPGTRTIPLGSTRPGAINHPVDQAWMENFEKKVLKGKPWSSIPVDKRPPVPSEHTVLTPEMADELVGRLRAPFDLALYEATVLRALQRHEGKQGPPSRGEPVHIKHGRDVHFGVGRHGEHYGIYPPGGGPAVHLYSDRAYVGNAKKGQTHTFTPEQRAKMQALFRARGKQQKESSGQRIRVKAHARTLRSGKRSQVHDHTREKKASLQLLDTARRSRAAAHSLEEKKAHVHLPEVPAPLSRLPAQPHARDQGRPLLSRR